MATIMIFGTLWGLALREWRGSGPRTMLLLAMSVAMLVASTIVVGYGNYLSTGSAEQTRSACPSVGSSPVSMATPSFPESRSWKLDSSVLTLMPTGLFEQFWAMRNGGAGEYGSHGDGESATYGF